MHAANTSPANDNVVAYLVADDPPAADWLEDMGVVAIEENGAWRLTALGEVAMARFNGRYARNQCFVSNVLVAPAADASLQSCQNIIAGELSVGFLFRS